MLCCGFQMNLLFSLEHSDSSARTGLASTGVRGRYILLCPHTYEEPVPQAEVVHPGCGSMYALHSSLGKRGREIGVTLRANPPTATSKHKQHAASARDQTGRVARLSAPQSSGEGFPRTSAAASLHPAPKSASAPPAAVATFILLFFGKHRDTSPERLPQKEAIPPRRQTPEDTDKPTVAKTCAQPSVLATQPEQRSSAGIR